jgi:regulatory protein
MRSERELRFKLIEKEFDPATVDNVVHHLHTLGLINDKVFAEAFVHDAQLRKPAGKKLLFRQLRLKGIAPPVIDDVLNEKMTSDEEQTLAFNSAQHLVERYRSSRKQVDEEKQRQRVAQFLFRRGFSWATIAPVLQQLFSARSIHQGG